MARTKFVAGNWKMFKSPSEAVALVTELKKELEGVSGVQVAVCPVYVSLSGVKPLLAGSGIELGAQNTYVAEKNGAIVNEGAYTGEVSPSMLKEAGCDWVILGHSERRQYFGETDEGVNRKLRGVFSAGMLPIVCVGETIEQRCAGTTASVVETQVRGCLNQVDAEYVRQTVIAYEPVWAIGTGETATPEQAQEVHALIRSLLTDLYDGETASAVRIQYGGSVKPNNAEELFGQPDIDGGLIGGASLKAESFAAIVKAAAP